MRRLIYASWLGVFPLMLAGCGQGGPTTPANTSATATDPQGRMEYVEDSAVIPANLDPQQTVVHYLQAVKEGDEEQVAALLTEVARRKTAEANIAVAPPGSETASFSVGDLEIVSEDKKTAHVASMWTDVDEAGTEQTLRIVWVVRQDPEGWRIAGMITRLSPQEPMLVLNFEEPEEVVRRNQEEITRRQAAADGKQQDGTDPAGAGTTQQGTPEAPRQARNPTEDDSLSPR